MNNYDLTNIRQKICESAQMSGYKQEWEHFKMIQKLKRLAIENGTESTIKPKSDTPNEKISEPS